MPRQAGKAPTRSTPPISEDEGDESMSSSDETVSDTSDAGSDIIVQHQVSIMEGVRDRMSRVKRIRTAGANELGPVSERSKGSMENASTKRSCWVRPLWVWISLLMVFAVLLGAVGGVGILTACILWLKRFSMRQIKQSRDRQRNLLQAAVVQEKITIYDTVLSDLQTALETEIVEAARGEVEDLWTLMVVQHHLNPAWEGKTEPQRELLERHIWQHSKTWKQNNGSIYVIFCTGQIAGVTRESGQLLKLDSEGFIGPTATLNIIQTDAVNGADVRHEGSKKLTREQAFPGVPGCSTPAAWQVKPQIEVYPWQPLTPWTQVSGRLGMIVSRPITYCGDYSCYQGAVRAEKPQGSIDAQCLNAYQWLKQREGNEWEIPMTENSTAVFIVSLRGSVQSGLLVSSSNQRYLFADEEVLAVNSRSGIIAASARAILKKYGNWTHSELISGGMRNFTFRQSALAESSTLEACDSLDASIHGDTDCFKVGTKPVRFGFSVWLEVVTMPACSMHYREGQEAFAIDGQIGEAEEQLNHIAQQAAVLSAVLYATTIALSIVIAMCLSRLISRPLRGLSKLMKRLQKLDFSHHDLSTMMDAGIGERSCIREVHRLRHAFQQLSHSIEVFARFVPDTVVNNIVQGKPHSADLHVEPRDVTIMFSDIQSFTNIAEQLAQRDLLFLLTLYLSVMTQIADTYEGSVAEILGDGLLIFWNTPDSVKDHASKACAAALAMQAALPVLNAELEEQGLPSLAVRIGVHTGTVLAGNIGSTTKMKFGCMGDPVNLASRLEGLCKFYGVSILCSSATRSACPLGAGFEWRHLDLVQVKGKTEPTGVHELLGMARVSQLAAYHRSSNTPGEGPQPASSAQRSLAQAYEQALRAYQLAQFAEAARVLEGILAEHPVDAASKGLLERVQEGAGTVGLSTSARAAWTGILAMTEK